MAVAATLYADRLGRSDATLVPWLAGWLQAASRIADGLSGAGHALALARWPLLALAVLGWARGFARGAGATGICVSLVLAVVGQSFLCDGELAAGVAALLLACTAYLLQPPSAREVPVAARVEVPLALGLLGLFAALSLHQLDVFPPVLVDEIAYHQAAQMFLGRMPPDASRIFDWLDYSYERFRAQIVPLSVQALALAGLSPGLLPLRIAAALAWGAALLVGFVSVRARLGARTALWMLAVAAVAPQVLVFARLGFYIPLTVLHSALCFAALLRLREHFQWRRAALLGALVGVSLYLYQLSWFVPILVASGLGLGLSAPPARERLAGAAVAGLFALATLLPGLALLREGFADVADQTFDDRAVWSDVPTPYQPRALVRSRRPLQPQELDALARDLPRLVTTVVDRGRHRTDVSLQGPPMAFEKVAPRLKEAGWKVLDHDLDSGSATSRLRRMLARLVYAPSRQLGRWVPPLVPTLIAPLVLLGCLEAFRRRREPAIQLLVLWAVVGAILPGVIGGPAGRRALLIWPFVAALAALPLSSLTGLLAERGQPGRVVAGALSLLFFTAVAAEGAHVYFDSRVRKPTLPVAKLLKGLPRDEQLFATSELRNRLGMMATVDPSVRAEGRRLEIAAGDPASVRALSCAQPPPFTWVTSQTSQAERLSAVLAADFRVAHERRGPLLLWRVEARRAGSCGEP